jgi:hypothetical protein
MKISAQPLAAIRALLPVLALVTVIVTGVVLGVEVMLLVLAFFALIGVILLLWSSVQSLAGQSPLTLDEALTLAAPSAEEEQKRAALRALKDIEYERSVGKISPEDYAEFSARYRAEAMRLMQLLDEGEKPAVAQIDALIEKRLAERERAAANKASKANEPEEPSSDEPSSNDAPTEDSASDTQNEDSENDADKGAESAGSPASDPEPQTDDESAPSSAKPEKEKSA